MKAIIALEELIKEDEAHIKLSKKQLSEHESGVKPLSKLAKASAESTLESATVRLEKNQNKLQELLKKDISDLEKEERMKEAIKRKNYFDFQKKRIERDVTKPNDIKLEAMIIVDELPEDKDLGIEDDILWDVAEKSIKMQLTLHEKIDNKLKEIQSDFQSLLKDLEDEDISELALLSNQIAVLVLHLSVLIENIEENIENDEKELPFPGLPKFEDWWIQELWHNHQAYLGLFKWRQIVAGLCQNGAQKRAWDVIFANWISIKSYICHKGELAYKYNFAFDTLMQNHTGLEEELATASLISMESILYKLTKVEDFTKVDEAAHQLVTEYTKFKRVQLNYEEPNEEEAK